MNNLIARRKFITGAATLSLVAGCKSSPAAAFLGLMSAWNQRAEALMFSPTQLAPELPESDQTNQDDIPVYALSAGGPPEAPLNLPPSSWTTGTGA